MVIGRRGSVHYLVHQGDVVRVAACQLVTVGEAEEQIGGEKTAVERKSEESTKSSIEPPKHKMKSMTVTLDQAGNDDKDVEV